MEAQSTGFALLRSRYGAFMIDALFFLVLWFMGALLAGSAGLDFNRWNAIALLAAYFGLLPATPMQATAGKRACGIKVTDKRGAPIGVGRALARFAASVPSIGLFGIGFLPAAWTPRRQALHDLIAGTLVVRLDASPESIGPAPPMSWTGRAFACFVVVSSALVVYANVSLYRAIEMREQFNEAFQSLSGYRAGVAEALEKRGPMPPPAKPTAYVKSLRAGDDGRIVMELTDAVVPGGRIVLAPPAGRGDATWKCSGTGIPEHYLPASCR